MNIINSQTLFVLISLNMVIEHINRGLARDGW